MAQIALAAALVAVALWTAVIYNRFVTFRNRCRNSWSQVDVQLERRHELIPKLADVVERYAAHERDSFQHLAEARTRALGAGTVAEKGNAEDALTRALSSVFAIAEAYPGLKAHRSFLKLQRELSDAEDKIRFARQFYNDTAMRYNTSLAVFPNIILARLFRFREEDYFECGTS